MMRSRWDRHGAPALHARAPMTVAENIILGAEPETWPRSIFRGCKRIRALSKDLGLAVDPDATSKHCPLGSNSEWNCSRH